MKDFPAKIKAVIFDLDGTLVDSIPLFYKVFITIFLELGLPRPPYEALKNWLKQGRPDWNALLPDVPPEQREHLGAKFLEIGRTAAREAFANELRILPGVKELLRLLTAKGCRIGLVTSGSSEFTEQRLAPLRTHGLVDLIEQMITRDDVRRIKPAPDPLLKCAGLLTTPPGQCLSVGDADVDVRAGKAAGMMTAGVTTGVDDLAALRVENPDAILENLTELAALLK